MPLHQEGDSTHRSPAAVTAACLAAAPVVVAPAKYGASMYWFFESLVGVGSVKMGAPGIAAQIFFISPFTTMQKIVEEKSTGKLPMLPYSSMYCNGAVWCTYGFLLDNPAIWVPNTPAVILGGIFSAVFCKYCPKDADWLPGNQLAHLGVMAGFTAAIAGIALTQDLATSSAIIGKTGVLVCIIMFTGPLAALGTVLKDKSTKSLPFPMMLATVVNCSLWTFYGFELINDFNVWFPNGLGLLLGLAQAALFMRFGIHK